MSRPGPGDVSVATVMSAAEALKSATDEQQRIEAMGLLIYSCAGQDVDRPSQSAAAAGGVIPILAPLVAQGSMHHRMMASNTLLIMCFKHTENCVAVGRSLAVEAAIRNVVAPSDFGLKSQGSVALKRNDDELCRQISIGLLSNIASFSISSHARLLSCGAAAAAVDILRALCLVRRQRPRVDPEEIHDKLIAWSVSLLHGLSDHAPSVRQLIDAGAIEVLAHVVQGSSPLHGKYFQASAAFALANVYQYGATLEPTAAWRMEQPEPLRIPEAVLVQMVEALPKAIAGEVYMGYFFQPFKVAMGLLHLIQLPEDMIGEQTPNGIARRRLDHGQVCVGESGHSRLRRILLDACAIGALAMTLELTADGRARFYGGTALYELVVGNSKLEAALATAVDRPNVIPAADDHGVAAGRLVAVVESLPPLQSVAAVDLKSGAPQAVHVGGGPVARHMLEVQHMQMPPECMHDLLPRLLLPLLLCCQRLAWAKAGQCRLSQPTGASAVSGGAFVRAKTETRALRRERLEQLRAQGCPAFRLPGDLAEMIARSHASLCRPNWQPTAPAAGGEEVDPSASTAVAGMGLDSVAGTIDGRPAVSVGAEPASERRCDALVRGATSRFARSRIAAAAVLQAVASMQLNASQGRSGSVCPG